MLAYMNFQQDFEKMVLSKFKALGGKGENPATAFVKLAEYEARQVPLRKYSVHLSNELLENPLWNQYTEAIQQIIGLLKNGESITHCLSKRSGDINFKDRLLSYWCINHLHPVVDGEREVGRKSAFTKARANHSLFFRLHYDNIYFIDLQPHPPTNSPTSWIEAYLVRILDRHWPHLHILFDPNPPANDALTDQEHKTIFSKRVNACVTTDRGQVMAPGGLTSAGTSFDGTVRWLRLYHTIRHLQVFVASCHESLFPSSHGIVRNLSLDEIEAGGRIFHVLDGLTGARAVLQANEDGFEILLR